MVLFEYLRLLKDSNFRVFNFRNKNMIRFLFNTVGTENLTRVTSFIKENVVWGSQQNQTAIRMTRCQLFSETDVKIALIGRGLNL